VWLNSYNLANSHVHGSIIGLALMAEIMACWKAVEAAVAHGMSRVQVETDSLLLQKGVLSNELDLASAGIIFQEIRTLICEQFLHFECLYVPHICN